jgi:hypothetical protein
VVLAGHPRLKHELRRPSREETGARTTVFELEGIKGHQRRYITWLLEQGVGAVAPREILTPEALELLAERLMTPLQIEHYLARVLEQAYRVGEKPVTPALVQTTLAPDLHGLEPTLTRYGYNVNVLRSCSTSARPKCARFSTGSCRQDKPRSCITSSWRQGSR